VVWGAAIVAIGAIGFIPGLRPVSRGLLALIVLVLILSNYQGILSGFQNAWTKSPGLAQGSSSGKGIAGGGSLPTGQLAQSIGSIANFGQGDAAGAFGSGYGVSGGGGG
jgi:hypothetical protein